MSREIPLILKIEKLEIENIVLKQIMENHQKIIAVMDNRLANLGVNFNFDTVDEEWAKLKAVSEQGD